MRGKQLTLIVTVLILVAGLFYLGYKSPKASTSKDEERSSNAFDLKAFLEKSTNKIPPALQNRLAIIGKQKNDSTELIEISQVWDSLGNSLLASHYLGLVSDKYPSEQTFLRAGKKFYETAAAAGDTSIQLYAGKEAKKLFEKVLEYNAGNLDAKNALGILYIQVENNPMKGVSILKEVLTIDSNNVQAIFTLAMMSVQSGQLDKAELRIKKLISLQPFNPDYYFYLADIYARSGKAEKAIQTYETCKSLVKDEGIKKEIESVIQKLKKS